jgi:proteasome accessory factor C
LQDIFAVLWQASEARVAVRIDYTRAQAEQAEERVVHPWAVVRVHQYMYLIGWCTTVTDVRVFRLDRIARATAEETAFEVPPTFDVDTIVRDGRIFSGELPDDQLVVRYSPHIARWIAEREQCELDADGSVTVTWPLADDDWAVRHVLQYGADAQVVAPVRLRELVRARLEQLLTTLVAN